MGRVGQVGRVGARRPKGRLAGRMPVVKAGLKVPQGIDDSGRGITTAYRPRPHRHRRRGDERTRYEPKAALRMKPL